jgi:hypothetical protein
MVLKNLLQQAQAAAGEIAQRAVPVHRRRQFNHQAPTGGGGPLGIGGEQPGDQAHAPEATFQDIEAEHHLDADPFGAVLGPGPGHGLLASLGLAGSRGDGLDLSGPDRLREFLEGALHASSTRIGYPLRIHRVKEAAQRGTLLLDDGDITVRCAPLTHRVPAYGYRVERKPRPGRFDVEKARELGIPPGPVYAELKAGRSVTLDDGRIIFRSEVLWDTEPTPREPVPGIHRTIDIGTIRFIRGGGLGDEDPTPIPFPFGPPV